MCSRIAKTIVALSIIFSMLVVPTEGSAYAKSSAGTAKPRAVNISVVPVSISSVKIAWKKQKNVDGYAIYQYDKVQKKYKRIKTASKNKNNYVKDKLKSGVGYTFRVVAFKKLKKKTIYGYKAKGVSVKMPKAKSAKAAAKKNNGKKVISIAKTRVGCRYVFGGKGPTKFDCSGFVYWVNKQAYAKRYTKKKVPKGSAQGQYNSLKKYRIKGGIKKAKPGDIVFFNRKGADIHHVALYYGKGKIIHASNYKTGVCIKDLSYSLYGGSRVYAVVRLPGL